MDEIIEGRIVHYVLPSGQHRAAIISDARGAVMEEIEMGDGGESGLVVIPGERGDGNVSLLVFGSPFDESPIGQVPCAMFDEETKAPETWHWPERE